MTYSDLPERWKEELRKRSIGNSKRVLFSAEDFRETVELLFEDESYAEFRYAVLIDLPGLGEIGVFTEHCGYHIFRRNGVEWRTTSL